MKKSLNRSDFFVYMVKKHYLCTRKDTSNKNIPQKVSKRADLIFSRHTEVAFAIYSLTYLET